MVIIYAATIFLSAFLLFQVQPVVGKMVLPWFGGSAAVWTTCLLLFQVLLLLGYLYAHLVSRYLRPRQQALLHTVLLIAAALCLPLSPAEAWKPAADSDPALLLLGMLVSTVGLPYFLLSSTGPLLQHWFAAERPGSVPYRLFALSNFGSMLGLLSFPLAFEPAFTMSQIGDGWSAGFMAFAGLSALLSVRAANRAAHASAAASAIAIAVDSVRATGTHGASANAGAAAAGQRTAAPAAAACDPGDIREPGGGFKPAIGDAPSGSGSAGPARRELALWCVLAAVPTVFLMAATSHLTANIAPMPLLWVLPLAIYLLTFILCFESGKWYRRKLFLPLLLGLTPLIIGYIDHPSLLPRGIAWPVALYCAGVFIFCMSCHGELSRLKPAPQHLTGFYLMIATGGAIGGAFTALLAPRIFNDDYELPLACLATLAVMAYTVGGRWSKAMLTSASLLLLIWAGMLSQAEPEFKARNFYGTVKVKESGGIRQLSHGAIMHGMQFLDPARRRWPTAYFGPDSGAGAAFRAVHAPASAQADGKRIGIVGLGAGTLAAYCRSGDTYRFYEINPLVASLAASHFSYLQDCPGKTEVVPGDARLSMEREPDQHYDLLILDAFSGDAIPVHLLTLEAFATWFRHLNPDGILAVHISNLYLDLAPVVANAAAIHGKQAFLLTSRGNKAQGTNAARWVLIGPPAALAQTAARPLAPAPSQRLWTDNYSSIAGILK